MRLAREFAGRIFFLRVIDGTPGATLLMIVSLPICVCSLPLMSVTPNELRELLRENRRIEICAGGVS